MRVLRKIVTGLLILLLAYGGVLLVERLITQELTRVSDQSSGESVGLIWRPRLLRGDGVCSLKLVNATDEFRDSAELGSLSSGLDALQTYGQMTFEGRDVVVADRRTGEVARRFEVRDGRLVAAD